MRKGTLLLVCINEFCHKKYQWIMSQEYQWIMSQGYQWIMSQKYQWIMSQKYQWIMSSCQVYSVIERIIIACGTSW